jgi:hypothetical protein
MRERKSNMYDGPVGIFEDYEEEESNLEDRFEQFNDEYNKFERIPEKDRLHPNKTLCGYLYVYNLMQEPKKFSLNADHDIVYLVNEDELQELTDSDIIYLTRCGLHLSEYGIADFC